MRLIDTVQMLQHQGECLRGLLKPLAETFIHHPADLLETLIGTLHQLVNAFTKCFSMLQQCLVDQVAELFHSI